MWPARSDRCVQCAGLLSTSFHLRLTLMSRTSSAALDASQWPRAAQPGFHRPLPTHCTPCANAQCLGTRERCVRDWDCAICTESSFSCKIGRKRGVGRWTALTRVHAQGVPPETRRDQRRNRPARKRFVFVCVSPGVVVQTEISQAHTQHAGISRGGGGLSLVAVTD